MKLLVLGLTTGLWLFLAAAEQSYVVTNEQLEFFEGDEETLVDFAALSTIKRERFINGSVTFNMDLDDDIKFQVELFSSPAGDGNYDQLPMGVPPTGVCEGFKKFYVQFVQHSLIIGETTNMPFVPDEGLCPFPAGTYYVTDILLNTEAWPSQVPRGILKCVITFFKNDVNAGGLIVVIKIEDRHE